MKEIFCAGFAKAAGDADDRQLRHGGQLLSGFFHIPVGNRFLNGPIQPVGQGDQQRLQKQRQTKNPAAPSRPKEGWEHSGQVEQRQRSQQTLDPRGINQGLFGLVQPVQPSVTQ